MRQTLCWLLRHEAFLCSDLSRSAEKRGNHLSRYRPYCWSKIHFLALIIYPVHCWLYLKIFHLFFKFLFSVKIQRLSRNCLTSVLSEILYWFLEEKIGGMMWLTIHFNSLFVENNMDWWKKRWATVTHRSRAGGQKLVPPFYYLILYAHYCGVSNLNHTIFPRFSNARFIQRTTIQMTVSVLWKAMR